MNDNYYVKVFYTGDEVQAALKNDPQLIQKAQIHVFGNDTSALSTITDQANVEVHGTTGMMDKIKSWFISEDSQHDMHKFVMNEQLEQSYRDIIDKGGTIIFISKEPEFQTMPEHQTIYDVEAPSTSVAGDIGLATDNMTGNLDFIHSNPPTNKLSYPTPPTLESTTEENSLLQRDEMASRDIYSSDDANVDTNKLSFNRIPEQAAESQSLQQKQEQDHEQPNTSFDEPSLTEQFNNQHATQNMDETDQTSLTSFQLEQPMSEDFQSASGQVMEEENFDELSDEQFSERIREKQIGKAHEYRRHDLP